MECDYRQVLCWCLNSLHTSIQRVATLYSSLLHSTASSSLSLLGSGFNGGHSPSFGFLNCPWSQLSASHSNNWQRLNPRSSLTDSELESVSDHRTDSVQHWGSEKDFPGIRAAQKYAERVVAKRRVTAPKEEWTRWIRRVQFSCFASRQIYLARFVIRTNLFLELRKNSWTWGPYFLSGTGIAQSV
jgi:hypothetical protein